MSTPNTPSPSTDKTLAELVSLMLSQDRPRRQAATKAAKTPPGPTPPQQTAKHAVGTPQWRLSTRWTDVALVCTTQIVRCTNCRAEDHTTQPFIYIQRYHPHFGVHLEAITPSSPTHAELPRRLHTITSDVKWCRHCFLTADSATTQLPLFPSEATRATLRAASGAIMLTDLFNSNGATPPQGEHETTPKAPRPQPHYHPLATIPTPTQEQPAC